MELSGLNLIGPELSGKGTEKYRATDPSSLVELDTEFTEATTAEIDAAVRMAVKAFDSCREKSFGERASLLEAIAVEIFATGDFLIERCMAETALPEARLTGERMRTVNQLKLFASVVREGLWLDARIDTAIPDRQPAPKPDIRQMQLPLGPVGVFGASNFPLAFSVAGGDTASALAAGCPVIVKAHPLHPGTSEIVGQAILRAIKNSGMPDGLFSMIHGKSNRVGMALVRHPDVKAIGFTGSFRGGKALFDAANQREIPIPVFAEMGSVNPVFILPGAMKRQAEDIARGMVQSFTLGVGQFCTNPGLVISQSGDDSEKFIEQLSRLSADTPAGTMLSEGIKSGFLDGAERLKNSKGVMMLAEGKDPERENSARARVFATTGQVFLDNPQLAEEVFGPSTLGVQSRSRQEMIEIARKMGGHLTATLHGTEEDLEEYRELVKVLETKVGRLIFNGYPTGVEVCHSMVHGGPFPATTAAQSTSVGTAAIRRFSRPFCYQDFPQSSLPAALKDENPLNIWRLVNGELTKDRV